MRRQKRLVSENDPDIEVRWFDSVADDWADITEYCKAFNVKNAGILKVSQATVLLNNKAGRFTSGEGKIDPYSHFWILGNVRPTQDTIFGGRFYGYTRNRSGVKKHEIELTLRGYEQKLLRDTKTKAFGEEGDWTRRDVLDEILAHPDSGFDTEITLEADEGAILGLAGEECDFERDYLLDCLKKIAEKINYDGYLYVADGGAFKLVFKEVGTIPSNPPVTLTHPFVSIRSEFSLDDVENYFLVKGGYERGVPPYRDEWTEAAMAKYDPDIWIPDNAGTVIEDDNIAAPLVENSDTSIKISSTSQSTRAYLDIAKTEEAPYIDCTSRFSKLFFWAKMEIPEFRKRIIELDIEDNIGNRLTWANGFWAYDYKWINPKITLDPTRTPYPSWDLGGIHGWWYYSHKETEFNWKITKVRFKDTHPTYPRMTIWIDGFYFAGAKKIDPLLYPVWNPPIKDDNSVSWYGRSLAWYVNESIWSKNDAQEMGKTILSLRKNPHRKFVCKKGAKIWVKPSQVMTLHDLDEEIDNEEYRALEIETDWKTPSSLRTTFTLVPKTYKVSSKAYLEDLLSGLIRGGF